MSKAIEASGLKKHYRRGVETVKALDGIDFAIDAGEMVAIVGPSGSGKTTLMNLVSCLDVPTAGRMKIDGADVTEFTEDRLIGVRRKSIGFIFQKFHLVPSLSARENVELPLLFSRKPAEHNRITRLLDRVGLGGRTDLRVDMLSGGDKQRVAIARALVNEPRVLIADEPTGRLETKVRDSLLELFRELAAGGLAVFIATHDLELAARTQRVIHLQDGRIVPRRESSLYC